MLKNLSLKVLFFDKKICLLILFLTAADVAAQFIKISESGQHLPINSQNWRCVLDKQTKLMWEIKTNDYSLHNASNTYTWYDKISGVANGAYSHNCNFYNFCNTDLFIKLVNDFKLCGYDDWRLPTFRELNTLVRYTDSAPLIDKDFFPYTQKGYYWSSTIALRNRKLVLDVPFFYGGTSGSEKGFDNYIRIVRNQQ